MDLYYTPEEEKFRLELRELLERLIPDEIRDSASSRTTIPRSFRVPIYKALRERGWMCPSWPKEYGGPGFSMAEQIIFQEEMGRVGGPNMDLGVIMAAPMIMRFGTQEQKDRYLPKMLEAEEMWCQGFSEPNAGSDLASLAATARLDGDDYVINGQKIWTSNGEESDWMFILVRTEPRGAKKQAGISFLLLDMKTPGIEVHPIHQITGKSNFTEVFFHDVRVPSSNLLGQAGEGWKIAKALLTHERVGVFSGDLIRRTLVRVADCARRTRSGGRAMIDDASVRRRIAQASMEIDTACYLGYRNKTRLIQGQEPGPESSVIKLFSTEAWQNLCDLAGEIQGPRAQLWDDEGNPEDSADAEMARFRAYSRSFTLAGGTSEIQRNIIAENVLGMPR